MNLDERREIGKNVNHADREMAKLSFVVNSQYQCVRPDLFFYSKLVYREFHFVVIFHIDPRH